MLHFGFFDMGVGFGFSMLYFEYRFLIWVYDVGFVFGFLHVGIELMVVYMGL